VSKIGKTIHIVTNMCCCDSCRTCVKSEKWDMFLETCTTVGHEEMLQCRFGMLNARRPPLNRKRVEATPACLSVRDRGTPKVVVAGLLLKACS